MSNEEKLSAKEITRLCEEWCLASKTPEGGIGIGSATEKYRLLKNGVVFHELGYEALCSALIGTAHVLLRPGLNVIVDWDHMFLWSWCGELLLSPRSEYFPYEQYEIKTLAETTVRASLVHCKKPSKSREEWKEQWRIDDLQSHHAKVFLTQSYLVLSYLAFPLLEALLKRACSQFIDFDGRVKSQFLLPKEKGGQKRYKPNDVCSSLRDLLFLHFNTVANVDLVTKLTAYRTHFKELDDGIDPFDLIYMWRNQSLHGASVFQTIGGTLLNLAFLIAISELQDRFVEHRDLILKHCKWEAQSGHRSPWSYYPPY